MGSPGRDHTPNLPESKTIGHFRFLYTTDDESKPKNIVSEEDIEATAKILNQAWDDFTEKFQKPKHYVKDGHELIDVRSLFLDLGNTLFGCDSLGLEPHRPE